MGATNIFSTPKIPEKFPACNQRYSEIFRVSAAEPKGPGGGAGPDPIRP